jgi:hypothetical protein
MTLLIRRFSGAECCLSQDMTAERRVEVTEDTVAGEGKASASFYLSSPLFVILSKAKDLCPRATSAVAGILTANPSFSASCASASWHVAVFHKQRAISDTIQVNRTEKGNS